MLNKEEKINIFKIYLDTKNTSYSDVMKNELYFYFFENENSLDFLNILLSKNDIINKVDTLITKMIMHEHEDGLDNIIINYL